METLAAGDPRQMGVYRLRARLGAGGMGQVFLGYSPAGRAVAVKVIHRDLARDPEFRTRFRREVAAAGAVSGAYTAPVVAAGPDDDPPWLATVFVPGPSLAEAVRAAGPLPAASVWRLAGGLVEALQAVHSCGLVHRDLKPANILLALDGPRVIDFGISRALEKTAMTSTGMIVGTPSFMSPEQAEDARVGPPSDVFSLGCVIVFAATGAGPFGNGPHASLLYRVVHAVPALSGVPDGLRELAEGCLAKAPADRPGLAALGALIAAGRAPGGDDELTSFWPVPVTRVIRAHEARLSTELREGRAGPGVAASRAAGAAVVPGEAVDGGTAAAVTAPRTVAAGGPARPRPGQAGRDRPGQHGPGGGGGGAAEALSADPAGGTGRRERYWRERYWRARCRRERRRPERCWRRKPRRGWQPGWRRPRAGRSGGCRPWTRPPGRGLRRRPGRLPRRRPARPAPAPRWPVPRGPALPGRALPGRGSWREVPRPAARAAGSRRAGPPCPPIRCSAPGLVPPRPR